MNTRRHFAVAALAALSLHGFSATAIAQTDYPSRPIQIVTSFPAGMATDVIARIIADKLSQRLGQPVVVTNKPGGAGTLATDSVAKAAPDGYTLLVANPAMATNPFLFKQLPYNTVRDFAGVALIAESPYFIVVNKALGANSTQELVELAKKNPKTINYASGGIGGATHLACALFAAKAGIEMTHVPYVNMANATTDLMSNRVQVACFPPPSAVPLTTGGKMIAIGASSTAEVHDPILVPSVKATTGIDFIASNWNGLFAPAKTPKAILQKLAATMEQVLADDEVKGKLKSLGMTPRPLLLDDFDKYFQSDMQRWGPIIKATGATLD